jgi:hypothetical protein
LTPSRGADYAQIVTRRALLFSAFLVACSSGAMPPAPPDRFSPPRDAARDEEEPWVDAEPVDPPDAAADQATDAAQDAAADADPDGPSRIDGPAPDTGCKLGTADHCASCTDRCPGPTSGVSTERTCTAAKCDIRCLAEFYDVNGNVADGCEAADDVPVHDTEATAAAMATAALGDCDPIQRTAAVLPSDARKHAPSPTDRPDGRPDFFVLEIKDTGCVINATVTVLLTTLPAAASYELSSIYVCQDGRRMASTTRTVAGGTSAVLNPSTSCTALGMGDDSGTLFVYVRKLSGPHSDETYEIEIEP